MIKLLTIKHGSFLYGTNTPLSDIDLKTIFLPNYGDLLIGKKMEIFKERDAKPNESTNPGDIEEEFIPIQIFARHFIQNQTYALEVVFSYLQNINILYVNPNFELFIDKFFKELVNQFSNKTIDAIIGYSYSQALKYSLKGERLDAIKKLKEHIQLIQSLHTPNAFNKLTIEDYVLSHITKFSRDSKEPIFITTLPPTRSNTDALDALSIGNKTFAFNTTLKHFLKALNILEDKYGKRSEESLSGIDWKAMSHSVRIIQQGIEYLQTKQITFPRQNADYLLDVKQGKIEEQRVSQQIQDLFKQLKEIEQNSNLPVLTPELSQQFYEWLKIKMEGVYQIYDVA